MLKKWHTKTRQRGRTVVLEARNINSPGQRLGFNGGNCYIFILKAMRRAVPARLIA